MNGYYYKIYFTGAGGINMFQIVQVINKVLVDNNITIFIKYNN